jgi:hypothetical protein
MRNAQCAMRIEYRVIPNERSEEESPRSRDDRFVAGDLSSLRSARRDDKTIAHCAMRNAH